MKKLLTFTFLLAFTSSFSQQMILNGGGDMLYGLSHGYMYYDGGGSYYNPDITQNIAFKLVPGMTVVESNYITLVGDSIVFTRAGYYSVAMGMSIGSGSNETFKIMLYKNNVAQVSQPYVSPEVGMYKNLTWFWYVTVVIGDRLSFKILNGANSNDPVIKDMYVDIIKLAH